MKSMFKNLVSSPFLIIVLILFILKFLFDFYLSIELDSIDQLLSGTFNNITYFLILYALGLIIKEKGNKKKKKKGIVYLDLWIDFIDYYWM